MREKLTFVPPVDLIETAQKYARTIRRPDIVVEWQKTDSYEYAMGGITGSEVPTPLQDEFSPILTALGALLIDKWVCVAPGIGVIETLGGQDYVPWWYVYTYGVIHGGREQPDEMVTRPLCDARSPEEALRRALIEVVRNELDVQALYESESRLNFDCDEDVPQ